MNTLIKVALSLLVVAPFAPAVSAEPIIQSVLPTERQSIQGEKSNLEVISIENNELTLKMMGDDTMQTFMIAPETVKALELQPGSMVEFNYDNLMVGTIAAATQTNVDVEFTDGERTTYIIPESGNDYDLGDQLVVTPERILGEVSKWELSEDDITVVAAATPATEATSFESMPQTMLSESEVEVDSEAEYESDDLEAEFDDFDTESGGAVVPGLW